MSAVSTESPISFLHISVSKLIEFFFENIVFLLPDLAFDVTETAKLNLYYFELH